MVRLSRHNFAVTTSNCIRSEIIPVHEKNDDVDLGEDKKKLVGVRKGAAIEFLS